jgi:hypothetical protein
MKMQSLSHAFGLVGLILGPGAALFPATAQMTIQVVNQNRAYADTNVFISFGGAPTITGMIDGQAILLGTNYSIAQINKGCSVTSFSDGAKIFVSLGRLLTSGNSANRFARNFANPSLADYYTRWDKVELSYKTTDPGSVANLSADDFASIPMKLSNGSESVAWHYHDSMQAVLASLAGFSGNSTQSVVSTNSQIIRVISPHTSYSAPWPSMQPYIDYVKTNSIRTMVVGTYNGRADLNTNAWASQTYNLTAVINDSGDLVLTGSCSVAGSTTITIAATDVPEALYSANPFYTANGVYTNNSNSVFDAAVRDILAGFNLGLVGTSKVDPRTNVAFSNETTQVWYNYPGNGSVTSSLVYTDVFGALWRPGTTFFNQYANILSTNTDAYSFPFNDTLAKPLLPLINNPTLTITILPDSASSAGPLFSSIAISNGLATLTLVNLTVGSSNSIDRTSHLRDPNGGQNVTNFIAASTTTNYSEATRSTNTFFRARAYLP